MHRAAAVTGLLSLIGLPGCEEQRQPGPPVPLRSSVLHDFQAFDGGRVIWATDDRFAIVRSV